MALFTTLDSLSQTASSNAADGSVDAPSTVDNQLNLLASFIAQIRDGNYTPPAGTVLQEVVYTDVGSTGSTSAFTGLTTSTKNITPKSTNSKLVIECSFAGEVLAGGAGTNATAVFTLYSNTGATTIGAFYVLGISSASGANMQIDAPVVLRATLDNTTLSTVGFVLKGRYNNAATTFSATGQVWTIREIQN